jgi:hypothetical protein
LKWLNWAVLALLAFVLLFTKLIVDALGMENTLTSVLILSAPLILVAAGIEWMNRRQR